jgi:hypothetical protein
MAGGFVEARVDPVRPFPTCHFLRILTNLRVTPNVNAISSMLKSKLFNILLASVTRMRLTDSLWLKSNELRRPTRQKNHSQRFGIHWSQWLHLTYFLLFKLSIRVSWMNIFGRMESG